VETYTDKRLRGEPEVRLNDAVGLRVKVTIIEEMI